MLVSKVDLSVRWAGGKVDLSVGGGWSARWTYKFGGLVSKVDVSVRWAGGKVDLSVGRAGQ